MFRRPEPRLQTSGETISLWVKGRQLWQIDRREVLKVEIYKVDLITLDDIRCDIRFGDPASMSIVTFSEDHPDWKLLQDWLQVLPGFDTNWPHRVVKPAFVENRTVVYQAPRRSHEP